MCSSIPVLLPFSGMITVFSLKSDRNDAFLVRDEIELRGKKRFTLVEEKIFLKKLYSEPFLVLVYV